MKISITSVQSFHNRDINWFCLIELAKQSRRPMLSNDISAKNDFEQEEEEKRLLKKITLGKQTEPGISFVVILPVRNASHLLALEVEGKVSANVLNLFLHLWSF